MAALGAGGLEGTGFDGFGVAFGDAFAVVFGAAFPSCFLAVFLAVLAGLPTAALRLLVAAVLADAVDLALIAFPEAVFPAEALEAVLEDFLRVFLDIRLPFVAFGGSIIRVLRVVPGHARIKPAAGQI
jgi:hypothetical protein